MIVVIHLSNTLSNYVGVDFFALTCSKSNREFGDGVGSETFCGCRSECSLRAGPRQGGQATQ